eukprot:2028555-Amphidinium_carterae.1
MIALQQPTTATIICNMVSSPPHNSSTTTELSLRAPHLPAIATTSSTRTSSSSTARVTRST